MRIFNLLLIVCLGFAISVNAQNPKWINFKSGNYSSFIVDEGNYLWSDCSTGLIKINKTTKEKTFYNKIQNGMPLTEYNNVDAMAIDKQGNKWFATSDGLMKFDGNNWTVISGNPSDYVKIIKIDAQGNKWIGADRELIKYDGTNWTVYNKDNSGFPNNNPMTGNYINCIEIDSQGTLWIGVFGNGLVKFDGTNWTVRVLYKLCQINLLNLTYI